MGDLRLGTERTATAHMQRRWTMHKRSVVLFLLVCLNFHLEAVVGFSSPTPLGSDASTVDISPSADTKEMERVWWTKEAATERTRLQKLSSDASSPPPPNDDPISASALSRQNLHRSIADLGRRGQPREALELLWAHADVNDRTAHHAVLTALAKNGRRDEGDTEEMVRSVLRHSADIGRATYGLALRVCNVAGLTDLALELLRDMETTQTQNYDNNDSLVQKAGADANLYRGVIGLCGRTGRWDDARELTRRVKELERNNGDTTTSESSWDENKSYYDFLAYCPRIGHGKHTWWEIGRWFNHNHNDNFHHGELPRCIRIGVRPHRNPKENGISLVFYSDDDEGDPQKLGFILLRQSLLSNTPPTSSSSSSKTPTLVSSLYGMGIPPEHRGRGLAKVLLALWMTLCRQAQHGSTRTANVVLCTESLRKPLVCHVLQNTFGFVPNKANHNGSVNVRLVRLPSGETGLVPVAKKTLHGFFGRRDLRAQGLVPLSRGDFSSEHVSPVVRVGVAMAAPHHDNDDDGDDETFERTVAQPFLGGTNQISYHDPMQVGRALFGYLGYHQPDDPETRLTPPET